MSQLINVTIPVLNEEACLATNVCRLAALLDRHFEGSYELVIADNGSTDQTLTIARDLEREHKAIRAMHIDQRGRGRALKTVWTNSRAEILSYMDVDLSSDIEAFPSLIEPIAAGIADLSTGSRLLKSSVRARGLKREILSRGYNQLIRLLFHVKFSDAQCGFKALSRRAADSLLPLVKDDAWFFDTELLLLAERFGYRIYDLPIRWTDDPDSRVKVVSTAIKDVQGLLRLRQDFKRGSTLQPDADGTKGKA